jgi:DNA recombination protein RmuC
MKNFRSQQDQLLRIEIKFDRTVQQLESIQNSQQEKLHLLHTILTENFLNLKLNLAEAIANLTEKIQGELQQYRTNFDKHQLETLKALQDSVQKSMNDVREQIVVVLAQNTQNVGQRLDKLTVETNDRLKEISGQVEKRLAEGFEKTTATFTDVLKRLALIDEAQKRITELSNNVVSLQEVLSDKRSRGAFGEVQLSALIRNVMPENSFSFQYTLNNDKRVDCILFLPEPTGNIAIDAKFPLESYQKMMDISLAETERRSAEQQFRIDLKKHIQDIATKYIVPEQTSDGAIMFIPAEAVFAEIHAHYPDIVDHAHKARVWLTSPTTMMAILTTARAVLKDADTRKQVHKIQEHLGGLAKDFDRFQKRMDTLAKHIEQAHDDVKDVNTSASKITSKFKKIEQVELDNKDLDLIE